MKISPAKRRGMTLTELMVGIILISILSAAIMVLFRTSWLSYQNLVWQSKVNMEARRALDDICDTLRMGGDNVDFSAPIPSYYQISPYPYSNSNYLEIARFPSYPYGANYRTEVMADHDNQRYLRRAVGGDWDNARLVGQDIKSIEFEYEYRRPATSENDTAWQSVRVSRPGPNNALGGRNNDAAYLAHTIYVTVTAEVSPFGNGGTTYTRKMTSAVHLRGPYNSRTPRAKYVPL